MNKTKQITQAEREERVMRAIEFLIAFRVATAAQVYRAIYRKDPTGGTTWTKLMRKTEAAGYMNRSEGFGHRPLLVAAPGSESIISWGAPKPENLATKSIALQAHSLAVSSIASQILTAPEEDPMGVGEKAWKKIRGYVLTGKATLLGETQYRSAWAEAIHTNEEKLRGFYTQPDGIVATADGAVEDGDAYALWAWIIACKGTVWANGQWLPDAGWQEGDKVSKLRDHTPDAVLTLENEKHYSIAIEMELTTKNVRDYTRTLAEYQSVVGRALYQHVVWLYDRPTTGTYLKRALDEVGNIGGQIILQPITTVNKKGEHVWSGADVAITK
jgi:hypothetical protein